MGANTTWYVKVPVISYEWKEVSALTKSAVYEDYPNAIEILHWTDFEELQDE